METKFQTSFIPKAPLSTPAGGVIQKKPVSFFLYLATVIFFLSIILAGGAYAYNRYLDGKVLTLEESLDKNNKSFEPQTIDEYVRLSARLQVAKELLNNHISPSRIFSYLEGATLKSVRFADFKYTFAEGKTQVSLSGLAESYNSVAKQSEIFGNGQVFAQPIFSNLDLNKNGDVIFSFQASVASKYVNYNAKIQDSKPLEVPVEENSNVGTTTLETNSTTTSQSSTAGEINQSNNQEI